MAFESSASNLVHGDTNSTWDVFRKDLQTGQILRVSTSSSGGQANGQSAEPSISGDGRFVAFSSFASNLVQGDTNGRPDVFRKDLSTGSTGQVSTTSGVQPNEWSMRGSISADGRYVVFESYASNLVPGDTNGSEDVFRKDLQTGHIVRISTSASGDQGNQGSSDPSLSADGRYAAFVSFSGNLVPDDKVWDHKVFRKDLGPTTPFSLNISPSTAVGGSTPVGRITFAQPVKSAFTMALATNKSAVAKPKTLSLSIAAGTKVRDFQIATGLPTTQQVAVISASGMGHTAKAGITVLPPVTLKITPSTVAPGATATLTISLARPAPAGGVVVTLTTNTSKVAWPALTKVALAQGTRAKSVQVRTGIAGTAKVTASSPIGSNSAILVVK